MIRYCVRYYYIISGAYNQAKYIKITPGRVSGGCVLRNLCIIRLEISAKKIYLLFRVWYNGFFKAMKLAIEPIIPTIKKITAIPAPFPVPKTNDNGSRNGDIVVMNGSNK